jgi:hypothetical protein
MGLRRLRKIVKTVSKVAQRLAPVASFIPGMQGVTTAMTLLKGSSKFRTGLQALKGLSGSFKRRSRAEPIESMPESPAMELMEMRRQPSRMKALRMRRVRRPRFAPRRSLR